MFLGEACDLLEKHNGIIYINPRLSTMSKCADRHGTIAKFIDHVIEVLYVETG